MSDLLIPRAVWDNLLRAYRQGDAEGFQAAVSNAERLQRAGHGLEPLLSPLARYSGIPLEPGFEFRQVSDNRSSIRIVVPAYWRTGRNLATGISTVHGQKAVVVLQNRVWEYLKAETPEPLRPKLISCFREQKLGPASRLLLPHEYRQFAGLYANSPAVWVSQGWGLTLLSSTSWQSHCDAMGNGKRSEK